MMVSDQFAFKLKLWHTGQNSFDRGDTLSTNLYHVGILDRVGTSVLSLYSRNRWTSNLVVNR